MYGTRTRPRYKPLGAGKGLTAPASDGDASSTPATPAPPLPTSNFTTDGETAWWLSVDGGSTRRCVANGLGVLAATQTVLRSGLRAPFVGPDGKSWSTRPDVDGNWGPHSAAALWQYAKRSGMSADVLAKLKADAAAKKVTAATMLAAIQVAYYRPRLIDLDVQGERVQRSDPAILGTLQNPDALALPAGTVMWTYLQRPSVPPNLGTLAAKEPVCSLVGDGWTLDQISMGAPNGNRVVTTTGKKSNPLVWLLVALGVGYAISD